MMLRSGVHLVPCFPTRLPRQSCGDLRRQRPSSMLWKRSIAEKVARGRNIASVKCFPESKSSELIEKMTGEQLEVALQERDVPTIVDFYAHWCGPCLLMAKELEEVAAKMKKKIRIIKVDADEEERLSAQLRIEGLPTLMFFSPNPKKKALRVEGLIPADTVMKIIEEEL